MSTYLDLKEIFPKHSPAKLEKFAQEFNVSLKQHLARTKRKPIEARNEKMRINKRIKTLQKFIKFLTSDLFPFQNDHVLQVIYQDRDAKCHPMLLDILEEYIRRMQHDLARIKKSTPVNRPINRTRNSFCGEMIVLLYVNLEEKPTLSRDETPFNRYIVYGISRLEGKSMPPEQIYPIVKPIVKYFEDTGWLGFIAELDQHWESQGFIIK
jgi:hypothetical protein